MAVKIIRDGKVIHSDKKEVVNHEIQDQSLIDKLNHKIEQQQRIINDLNNQIKDLKADLRFYRIHS